MTVTGNKTQLTATSEWPKRHAPCKGVLEAVQDGYMVINGDLVRTR